MYELISITYVMKGNQIDLKQTFTVLPHRNTNYCKLEQFHHSFIENGGLADPRNKHYNEEKEMRTKRKGFVTVTRLDLNCILEIITVISLF